MRVVLLLAAGIVITSACAGGREDNRPQVTQRQRDSAIGASRLPGARGVGRALQASDSASSRRALEDSIAAER
jgi:hypothetical protein